jgi:hypothetical protein
MRKLIFREGKGICGICHKDKQDTVYHILNGCKRMCGDYIARHNLIADRLVEAINLNCHYEGEIYENRQVKLSRTKRKMESLFTLN